MCKNHMDSKLCSLHFLKFNCVILVIVIIKLVKTERRKRQIVKRNTETNQINKAATEAQAIARLQTSMHSWSFTLKYHRNLVTSAIILLPLLGITWIVGLFAVNENTVAFAYVFTILNSLQVIKEHIIKELVQRIKCLA